MVVGEVAGTSSRHREGGDAAGAVSTGMAGKTVGAADKRGKEAEMRVAEHDEHGFAAGEDSEVCVVALDVGIADDARESGFVVDERVAK